MGKFRIGSAALLVFTVGAAACGSDGNSSSNSSKAATIKIGSLHPLTGALAVDGKQMDTAAKMAADAINKKGGIKSLDGAKLEIVSADSQGKPDVGQTEAQRLASGGIAAFIGTFQSAVTINAATVAERSRVPLVIDVAAADEITQQGGRYVFRIQPNASAMGIYGARYLKAIADDAKTPIKTISYLHEQTAFGTSVFNAFKTEAVKEGFQVVDEIKYDAFKVTDLTTELTRVKASKPDVLAVTGYYNDGLLIARNAQSVKPDVKVVYGVAQGAYDLPQFPRDGGAASNFYMDSNYHFDASNDRVIKIRKDFQTKTTEEMRTPAVFAYQAVEVIADALDRAKSSDPVKVRDALAKTSFKDILFPFSGPIQFDARGENKNAQPVLMQVQSSSIVQVFPEKYAQKKPTFPATAWAAAK